MKSIKEMNIKDMEKFVHHMISKTNNNLVEELSTKVPSQEIGPFLQGIYVGLLAHNIKSIIKITKEPKIKTIARIMQGLEDILDSIPD